MVSYLALKMTIPQLTTDTALRPVNSFDAVLCQVRIGITIIGFADLRSLEENHLAVGEQIVTAAMPAPPSQGPCRLFANDY